MWTIQFSSKAKKQLDSLDKAIQRRIVAYLETRVVRSAREYGDMLTGDKKGLWRYRVGDYRIIAQMEDTQLLILIVRVGHRKDVYDF